MQTDASVGGGMEAEPASDIMLDREEEEEEAAQR